MAQIVTPRHCRETHMMLGKPKRASIGRTGAIAGAVMLACAVIALVYGLIKTP
jgi:hypothetical protein